ncbi:hypothetical protein GDO78_003946, partial [Eleutherodactylus coqui]
SFASTVQRQKHAETSTNDLQLSLSPMVRRNSRAPKGSLIALVTTDYLENCLSKPKKSISDPVSVSVLPSVGKSDSFTTSASEDLPSTNVKGTKSNLPNGLRQKADPPM